MTKKISLGNKRYALIDDDDYEEISAYTWYFNRYAYTCVDGKTVYMHRLINQTPDGMDTDHINRKKLDNRRSNLRSVTRTQNMQNCQSVNSNAGVRGVWFWKERNKYQAYIYRNYKKISLGNYDTLDEAKKAVARARKELHRFRPLEGDHVS